MTMPEFSRPCGFSFSKKKKKSLGTRVLLFLSCQHASINNRFVQTFMERNMDKDVFLHLGFHWMTQAADNVGITFHSFSCHYHWSRSNSTVLRVYFSISYRHANELYLNLLAKEVFVYASIPNGVKRQTTKIVSCWESWAIVSFLFFFFRQW